MGSEWAKYCVCTVGGNQPAVLPLSPPAGRQVSQRLAEEAKKRERFEELRQHLEQEQEVGQRARKGDQERLDCLPFDLHIFTS